MRSVRAGLASVLLLVPTVTAAPVADASLSPECKVKIGTTEVRSEPWEHRRLDARRVWPITDGSGVLVAVIDSGFNAEQAQLHKIHVRAGVNVSGVFGPADTRDCVYHGTAVTGIIAAATVRGVYFTGIAPGVTIMPIKEQQGDEQPGTNHIAQAIDAAVAARADVINVSITTVVGTPELERAVAAAERAGIVIVAAGGNDGSSSNLAAFPAAYSTNYPNVLAVAMTDQNDQVSGVSTRGTYINIAAPGKGVELPMPKVGYLANQDGTSFATPVVTGTVALVRAAHPTLSAAQVVSRIEATADAPPGVGVPNAAYGYGIVNPYLAVAAIRDDSARPVPVAPPKPIPPVTPRPAASRHRQHLALGVGAAILGLAVVVALVAALVRRSSALSGPPRDGTDPTQHGDYRETPTRSPQRQ
jgi:membrane-anchored mycosin MYCP